MPTKTFRRLAWATAVASYALVVLGATTKAYGAGLSCPDWPLCYGKLVPNLNALIALEWGHRLGALVVSTLALLTTVAAFRLPGERAPWVRGCLAALALLPVQAILGGMTVLFKLHPAVDASHLAMGTAFMSIWVAVAVSAGIGEGTRHLVGNRLALVPFAAAVSAYATMVIGSFMKSSGAGLACRGWPLCNGEVLPAGAGPFVLLHFWHRLAALLAGILILYTAYRMFRHAARVRALVIPAGVSAGLFSVQVLVGALAVLRALPPAVIVAHVAAAEALLAILVAMTAIAYRLSTAGVLSREDGPARVPMVKRPLGEVVLNSLDPGS